MDPNGHDPPEEAISVAEAKRRFSELIDRVQSGDRVLISRRGKPVMALVPPDVGRNAAPRPAPIGLAAVAGALADWGELEEVVQDIYAQRKRAKDREVPPLEGLEGAGSTPPKRRLPAARSASVPAGKGAGRQPKRRASPGGR